MSYEILLYPRAPGQDWVEVLAADEADSPAMDLTTLNRGVATFRRIEARLRDGLTEPVRTWVAEDLTGDVFGEFQTRDSRLRVELYDRAASVSAPYGGPSDPVHDLVRQAVEIVAAETGYEPYDPQVEDAFDGSFDDAAGQASLSEVSDRDDLWADYSPNAGHEGATHPGGPTAAPVEGEAVDAGDPDVPLDPRAERARLLQERRQQLLEERRQPAALRRRGWFNVIFGALASGIGLMRLSAGDTGILTWLFLGVGVFELVGAWFLFSQSRQAEAQQDEQPSDPAQPSSTPDDGPDEAVQR